MASTLLAGFTLPRVAAFASDLTAHLVFVSCTVLQNGQGSLDTCEPQIRDFVLNPLAANENISPLPSREMAVTVFGSDLGEGDLERILVHTVPEAGSTLNGPSALSGLIHPIGLADALDGIARRLLGPEEEGAAVKAGDASDVARSDLSFGHRQA